MVDVKSRLATAQWVLERTLGWISAAEIKVGVIVTIDVGMLGGLAAAFAATPKKTPWVYVLAISAAALAVVALGCAAYAVKPRLDGPKKSLLFFGRITDLPRADFVDRFKTESDEELLDDWTEQIHRNAEIAKEKHAWVTKAMAWSFLSAIPWVLAVAILANA